MLKPQLKSHNQRAIMALIDLGQSGGFSAEQIAQVIVVYVNKVLSGDYLDAFDAAIAEMDNLRKK